MRDRNDTVIAFLGDCGLDLDSFSKSECLEKLNHNAYNASTLTNILLREDVSFSVPHFNDITAEQHPIQNFGGPPRYKKSDQTTRDLSLIHI